MSILSDRIRERRQAKELTQKELSLVLNCSESAVRMWELSKNEPSVDTIESIADALNTTPDYLTGWSDDPLGNTKEYTPKLKSISRMEKGAITPEEDNAIASFIEYLMNKREHQDER